MLRRCRQRLHWALHEACYGSEPPPLPPQPPPQRSEPPRTGRASQGKPITGSSSQQQQHEQAVGSSLHSHPLHSLAASLAASSGSELAEAIHHANALLRSQAADSTGQDQRCAEQKQQQLEQQLAAAREDLARDESIFAGQAQELQELRVQLEQAQRQAAVEAQRQAQQLAEAQRWRAQAMQVRAAPCTAPALTISSPHL